MGELIAIWVNAIVTIVVFSYLLGDNIVYRIIQHAALGVAIGFTMSISWTDTLQPKWWDNVVAGYDSFVTTGDLSGLWWLLPLVFGAMWYFQLSKKMFWVSTIVSGLFIGVAAAFGIQDGVLAILPQIGASFKDLYPLDSSGDLTWGSSLTALNNLVFLVAMFTTLLYFFFSVRTDNILLRQPVKVGRLMIMICLGAMFGATVMTRMSYLLERMNFLYLFGRDLVTKVAGFF